MLITWSLSNKKLTLHSWVFLDRAGCNASPAFKLKTHTMQLTLFHIPPPPPKHRSCACGNRIWKLDWDECKWCRATEKQEPSKLTFEERLAALREENLKRTAIYSEAQYYLEDRNNKKPVEFPEDEQDKEMKYLITLTTKQ